VDVGPPLVAHRKPAVTGQPRQRTFHHPPVSAKPLASVLAPPGDARLDAPLAECLSATGEVVSFVGVQLRGALPRPAWLARRTPDRLDLVHDLLEDLRVVDVGGGENYGERYALSVRNKVALRARFAAIGRVLTDLLAPLLAGTLAESRHALDQSISSASPSLSSKARCSRCHTPASSCQSRSLRQHVEPDPQPISFGSISQGMPVLSTKTMPVRTARFGTRGLPPLGLGGSGGSSGSTISHSSSVTNSFAMSRSVASDHG
jgi:hypothetical protein